MRLIYKLNIKDIVEEVLIRLVVVGEAAMVTSKVEADTGETVDVVAPVTSEVVVVVAVTSEVAGAEREVNLFCLRTFLIPQLHRLFPGYRGGRESFNGNGDQGERQTQS